MSFSNGKNLDQKQLPQNQQINQLDDNKVEALNKYDANGKLILLKTNQFLTSEIDIGKGANCHLKSHNEYNNNRNYAQMRGSIETPEDNPRVLAVSGLSISHENGDDANGEKTQLLGRKGVTPPKSRVEQRQSQKGPLQNQKVISTIARNDQGVKKVGKQYINDQQVKIQQIYKPVYLTKKEKLIDAKKVQQTQSFEGDNQIDGPGEELNQTMSPTFASRDQALTDIDSKSFGNHKMSVSQMVINQRQDSGIFIAKYDQSFHDDRKKCLAQVTMNARRNRQKEAALLGYGHLQNLQEKQFTPLKYSKERVSIFQGRKQSDVDNISQQSSALPSFKIQSNNTASNFNPYIQTLKRPVRQTGTSHVVGVTTNKSQLDNDQAQLSKDLEQLDNIQPKQRLLTDGNIKANKTSNQTSKISINKSVLQKTTQEFSKIPLSHYNKTRESPSPKNERPQKKQELSSEPWSGNPSPAFFNPADQNPQFQSPSQFASSKGSQKDNQHRSRQTYASESISLSTHSLQKKIGGEKCSSPKVLVKNSSQKGNLESVQITLKQKMDVSQDHFDQGADQVSNQQAMMRKTIGPVFHHSDSKVAENVGLSLPQLVRQKGHSSVESDQTKILKSAKVNNLMNTKQTISSDPRETPVSFSRKQQNLPRKQHDTTIQPQRHKSVQRSAYQTAQLLTGVQQKQIQQMNSREKVIQEKGSVIILPRTNVNRIFENQKADFQEKSQQKIFTDHRSQNVAFIQIHEDPIFINKVQLQPESVSETQELEEQSPSVQHQSMLEHYTKECGVAIVRNESEKSHGLSESDKLSQKMMDSFGKIGQNQKVAKTEATLIQKDMTISNFLESGLNNDAKLNQTKELTEEPSLNLELRQNKKPESENLAQIIQTPTIDQNEPEFFAYRDNSETGDVFYENNQMTSEHEGIKTTNQPQLYLYEQENNIKCTEVYQADCDGTLEKSSSFSNNHQNQKYKILQKQRDPLKDAQLQKSVTRQTNYSKFVNVFDNNNNQNAFSNSEDVRNYRIGNPSRQKNRRDNQVQATYKCSQFKNEQQPREANQDKNQEKKTPMRSNTNKQTKSIIEQDLNSTVLSQDQTLSSNPQSRGFARQQLQAQVKQKLLNSTYAQDFKINNKNRLLKPIGGQQNKIDSLTNTTFQNNREVLQNQNKNVQNDKNFSNNNKKFEQDIQNQQQNAFSGGKAPAISRANNAYRSIGGTEENLNQSGALTTELGLEIFHRDQKTLLLLPNQDKDNQRIFKDNKKTAFSEPFRSQILHRPPSLTAPLWVPRTPNSGPSFKPVQQGTEQEVEKQANKEGAEQLKEQRGDFGRGSVSAAANS